MFVATEVKTWKIQPSVSPFFTKSNNQSIIIESNTTGQSINRSRIDLPGIGHLCAGGAPVDWLIDRPNVKTVMTRWVLTFLTGNHLYCTQNASRNILTAKFSRSGGGRGSSSTLLIDWLIDGMIGWLIDWLIDGMIDWLIDWFIITAFW